MQLGVVVRSQFRFELVEAPGVVRVSRCLAERVTILVKIGRCAGCRSLDVAGRSVEAVRRRGVVRSALSSPEWGSPREETDKDGKGWYRAR